MVMATTAIVDTISARCYHFVKSAIIGGGMVRTQIQLTAVKTVSKEHGISTAEVIRRAIDLLLRTGVYVEEGEKRMRALNIVGRFRSGRHDISKNHDAHLADAYSK